MRGRYELCIDVYGAFVDFSVAGWDCVGWAGNFVGVECWYGAAEEKLVRSKRDATLGGVVGVQGLAVLERPVGGRPAYHTPVKVGVRNFAAASVVSVTSHGR